MRKSVILTAIVLTFAGITSICRISPRTLASEQCSELCLRYADHEEIHASFVKDYPVNDSVTVDVTLLEAKSDTAWSLLLKDFNIKPPPQEVIDLLGENSIEMHLAPKRDYSLPMDSVYLNNDLIVVSCAKREISIFRIESYEQDCAIVGQLFDELSEEDNKPINHNPQK